MANITHWDPFGDRLRLSMLTDTFDDWFNRFVRPRIPGNGTPLSISVDVAEDAKAFTVKADIPGVKKEDISVSIEGNVVTIGAEVKRESQEKKGETVLREERYVGQMQRSFTLPTEVDQAKADAKYADGVLRLTLPKKPGAAKKTLPIK